jgi:hypothetical protein
MTRRVSGYVLLAALSLGVVNGQEDAKRDNLPFQWAPPRKDWEWDEDERFDELMEQLAINEASLDAVQAAVAKKTRRKSSQTGVANRSEENNRMMDRKGGGPMKWNEFYGTNAEKFFYHPIDPNTTYHTNTALRQMGKAEDDKDGSVIPSRQSLPVHQRPPQWDYIYQANETARQNALADASLAEADIEALERRRTQLEKEQAVLWCKLAFRAVQRLNMARKPLLRFQLASASTEAGEAERVNALSASARFLACSLAVVEKAEQDQAAAFSAVADIVTQARHSFEDTLLESSSLEEEWSDTQCDLGKFFKLSQMLVDKAKTMGESYAGAMDGDINKEAVRKERFRGMLQNAVVDYTQILLALNEVADAMKTDWKIRVDAKRKLEPLQLTWTTTSPRPSENEDPMRALDGVEDAAAADPAASTGKRRVVDQKTLRKAFGASKATYDPKSGILSLSYDFMRPEQLRDWEASSTPPEKGKLLKGVRLVPEDSLKHRGVFVEGSCAFHFAIANPSYRGAVLSAGDDVVVLQHPNGNAGRTFTIGNKTLALGNFGATSFRVVIDIAAERTMLKVNDGDVGMKRLPSGGFQFALYGGDNGADFGAVTISGQPEPEWFRTALQ